jgi:hypothetical protein
MRFSEHTQLIKKVVREKAGLKGDWELVYNFGKLYLCEEDTGVFFDSEVTLIVCQNTKTHEVKLFSAIGLGLIEPNE